MNPRDLSSFLFYLFIQAPPSYPKLTPSNSFKITQHFSFQWRFVSFSPFFKFFFCSHLLSNNGQKIYIYFFFSPNAFPSFYYQINKYIKHFVVPGHCTAHFCPSLISLYFHFSFFPEKIFGATQQLLK